MAPKMKSRQKASQEYWEEREKEALKQTRLTEEQFAAEIEKIYGDMRREVNSRISNWYVRYADESGIDIAEAKKRVSKLDMEEYAELARKYVELARKEETRALAFTDEANEQMKLYNLTMKVNRLENLKAQIGLELCGGFSQLEKKYGTFLNEQMMEEFDRQSGILAMTTQRPEAIRRQVEAVVNGSFHNATFSERLWNQQDALKGELDRLLSRALIQGLNPRAVAPELRKKFGASEQAADLLMITELCRVQTEAQKMAFKEYGYEEYTFICNGGACEACEGLSGKHFKVSEMLAGQNAPPMHPRCRCSTAAYMDREAFEKWLDALESGEDVRWKDFEVNNFTSNPATERGRTVRYGKESDFEQYSKTVHAKEVKNSGNNMFVDNSIQLTRKEIRNLDSMISKAKELHGANYTCNVPFVITDNAGRIASYNPRTNTFFVDYRLANPDKVIEQQQGFAAPDNIYSTIVHEIFHWKDAEDYRSAGNNIDRADFKSPYSQHNRSIAKKKLRSAGIDVSNPADIANISQYAYLKWLENDLEEVYTEYRTKELLKE